MFLSSIYSLYSNITNISGSVNLLEQIGIHKAYFYVAIAVKTILTILLLCVLIGIGVDKLSLMKPFKIIYAIILIYGLASNIYSNIVLSLFISNITEEQLQKLCKLYVPETYEEIYKMRCREYGRDLPVTRNIAIVSAVIGFCIDLLYYITTKNYINSVEKEEKEVEDLKNVENAY